MIRLLEDFRSALGFITIIPVGKRVKWSPLGMIKFFPLVGLLLGALLYGADLFFARLFSPAVTALLDTTTLVCLTGAFHIDGLGDAADGLFSHRPKERVLEIMKDSRIGMMGLVAVVLMLAVKTAGIYSLKTTTSGWPLFLTFLIVPAYARSGMIFGIRFLKYGRENTGTGLDLFERPVTVKDFVFFLIPVILSAFLGIKGLVLVCIFAAGAAGILLFYKIKLNCITGDMLGAMTEVMETLLFLAAGAAFF